ncbi:MAG: RNase adapter RapZ [Myxococcales bacterium]|nr:MAG: RNase adapter RapZ [Myxococcales bacterium]
MRIVIVTGMSGAGRSTALHVLEDLGFYCVDNLPPALAPDLIHMLEDTDGVNWVALGIDLRTGTFLEGTDEVLDRLSAQGHELEVLFLDCQDETLVRRFSESRRPHRLAPAGDLPGAIAREREQLASLRERASYVVDTSSLTVHELKRLLSEYAEAGKSERLPMVLRFMSFGFKYGLPIDADLVFDLRALPNPHFVPELKAKTGEDPDVSDFVLKAQQSQELLADIEQLLRRHIPNYEREGKAYLTVALGCTGGKHRSVALSRELYSVSHPCPPYH